MGIDEDRRRLLAPLLAGDRLGVLLDVDGTLSPIVERPEDARLQPGAREVLGELTGQVAVLAVISGRPTAEAFTMIGVEGVSILGSYGLGDLPPLPEDILTEVARVAGRFPGARVERKGGTVAVHLRGANDPDAIEAALAKELSPIAERATMEVARGKRVLELVPAGRDLKGEAVERTIADHVLDAVLYAGDDVADLGAFSALDRAAIAGLATVKVAAHGPETPEELLSAADLIVEGPEGVVDLLRFLLV